MDSKDEFEKARKNIIDVQDNKNLSQADFTGGASLIVAIDEGEHPFETKQVTTNWAGGADHVVVKGHGREEVLLLFHSELADGFYSFNNLRDLPISYIDESGSLQQRIWYGDAYVAVSDGGKTKYGALDVRFIPLYGESEVSVRGGFFCHLN